MAATTVFVVPGGEAVPEDQGQDQDQVGLEGQEGPGQVDRGRGQDLHRVVDTSVC